MHLYCCLKNYRNRSSNCQIPWFQISKWPWKGVVVAEVGVDSVVVVVGGEVVDLTGVTETDLRQEDMEGLHRVSCQPRACLNNEADFEPCD